MQPPASLDDALYALCCNPKPPSLGQVIDQPEALAEALIIERYAYYALYAAGRSLSGPIVTGSRVESPTDSPTVTIQGRGGLRVTDLVESLTESVTVTPYTLAKKTSAV